MLHIIMTLLFVLSMQAGPGQSRISDEQGQFFDAIRQGNCEQVAQYLNEHNNDIPDGALHKAIRNGKKEIVKLLIERGADVDQRYNEECPVHAAVSANEPELLDALLSHGASVDTITKPVGNTALHLACEQGEDASCALLLKHGASLVARNQNGDVPLHRAARGNTAIVKQLTVVPNCNLDVRQLDGVTPLMLAALHPSLESVDHLIACGVDLNLQDNEGNTALHLATRFPDSLVSVVALLLEKGANARIVNKKKNTPLHVASRNGFEQVALLIPHSDINAVNGKGKTPLSKAIFYRKYKIASALLDAGANPNIGIPTPLWIAVNKGCDRGGSELMQKLIEKGADLTFVDKNGKTLPEIACCDATRTLLQNGMAKQ